MATEAEKALQQIEQFRTIGQVSQRRESPTQTLKTWLPTMPLANQQFNAPVPKWLSKKTVVIGQ